MTNEQVEMAEATAFFNIPTKLCVLLNDVDSCRKKLDDFFTDLEEHLKQNHSEAVQENVSEIFSMVFSNLRCYSNYVIDQITDFMNPYLVTDLQVIISLKSEAAIGPALDRLNSYINSQLFIMNSFLIPDVFKKLLKRLWETIIQAVEELLLPKKPLPSITAEQANSLIKTVKNLRETFHADGGGIPEKALDELALLPTEIAKLYSTETAHLINIFNSFMTPDGEIKKEHKSVLQQTKAEHLFCVLKSRKETDKEVKNFLKKIKNKEFEIY